MKGFCQASPQRPRAMKGASSLVGVVECGIWHPANIAMFSGYNPNLRTNQVFTSCVRTA